MRLTELDGLIGDLEYPTTTDAIVAAHGRRTLAHANGDETVAEAIDRCGAQSFASADELRLTLYSSVCEDAIGRKGYTDRDPPTLGEVEHVSF